VGSVHVCPAGTPQRPGKAWVIQQLWFYRRRKEDGFVRQCSIPCRNALIIPVQGPTRPKGTPVQLSDVSGVESGILDDKCASTGLGNA